MRSAACPVRRCAASRGASRGSRCASRRSPGPHRRAGRPRSRFGLRAELPRRKAASSLVARRAACRRTPEPEAPARPTRATAASEASPVRRCAASRCASRCASRGSRGASRRSPGPHRRAAFLARASGSGGKAKRAGSLKFQRKLLRVAAGGPPSSTHLTTGFPVVSKWDYLESVLLDVEHAARLTPKCRGSPRHARW